MKRKKKTTTDALKIMDALWGNEPGWKEGIERERQKFALGELIRHAREARGLTQQELADRVGTSQSHISRIEDANYDRLMVSTLQRIAFTLRQRVEVRLTPIKVKAKA